MGLARVREESGAVMSHFYVAMTVLLIAGIVVSSRG